jgi:hypothetical protein
MRSRHDDGTSAPTDAERPEREHDGESDEWARMIEAFRSAAPRGGAPPWLEQRVMAEIEALPEHSPWQRALGWLVRPAQVRISPLAGGLAAAAVAAVVLFGRQPPTATTAGTEPGATGTEQVVYVQFVLEAPSATSVAVAGDFSDWQPSFTLEDADGDGVWTGRVPVRPGVHGYMFLIDETLWQTDPNAERYQDDGFGNRNAVLAVGASS